MRSCYLLLFESGKFYKEIFCFLLMEFKKYVEDTGLAVPDAARLNDLTRDLENPKLAPDYNVVIGYFAKGCNVSDMVLGSLSGNGPFHNSGEVEVLGIPTVKDTYDIYSDFMYSQKLKDNSMSKIEFRSFKGGNVVREFVTGFYGGHTEHVESLLEKFK